MVVCSYNQSSIVFPQPCSPPTPQGSHAERRKLNQHWAVSNIANQKYLLLQQIELTMAYLYAKRQSLYPLIERANGQPPIQKGGNCGYSDDLADDHWDVYRMLSDLETELKKCIQDTEVMVQQRVNMLLGYDHILRSSTYSVTKETLSRLDCSLKP